MIQAKEERVQDGTGGDEVIGETQADQVPPQEEEVTLGGEEPPRADGDIVSALTHSSRSGTTSVSATFQRQRALFQKDFARLKDNTTSAPDTKNLKASLVRSRLKDMTVWDLICRNESNPDFLDLFGENAEDILLLLEVTECKLEDLKIDYVDQIAMVKSCTQSGFQKRKYPLFSRKILDYYEFKQCWFEEVS